MSSVPLQVVRPQIAPQRRVYIPVAVLAILIAIVGFWPSYFGPLLAGKTDVVPIIHLHAGVSVGWIVFVIVLVGHCSDRVSQVRPNGVVQEPDVERRVQLTLDVLRVEAPLQGHPGRADDVRI